eukprot:6193882-Pleurochrysis_carterae.AAC.4
MASTLFRIRVASDTTNTCCHWHVCAFSCYVRQSSTHLAIYEPVHFPREAWSLVRPDISPVGRARGRRTDQFSSRRAGYQQGR